MKGEHNMELHLASAGDNVKIWDCNDFQLSRQLNPHDQNVSSLCWASDNSFLASVSMHSDDIVVMGMKNSENLSLHCGTGCICIDVNDTSRYLLSGGSDGVISVWDMKDKKVKKTYKDHKGPVTCARFNHGATSIASGLESGEIILYNVVTGQGCRPLIAPNVQAIKQVQYSRCKRSLLGSVSDDGCLNLWDCNTRRLIHTFDGHRAPATGLSFSPINDIFLMSVGLDKRIVCYDVQAKKVVKKMTADCPLTSIDTMENGVIVAVGTTRGKIYQYDLRMESTPLKTLDAHKSSVQCLRFQFEGKSENSGGKSAVTNKQQKNRQLPISSKNGTDVTSVGHEHQKTAITRIEEDVFSPLREEYQYHSNENKYHTSNDGLNVTMNNSTGETFTGGIFSPLNDNLDQKPMGLGLSPLTFSGYSLFEQSRNSNSGLTVTDYNRINAQSIIPATVNSPSDEQAEDGQPNNITSRSHSPHVTFETTPREKMSTSKPLLSINATSASAKDVVAVHSDGDECISEEADMYAFLTHSSSSSGSDVQSPELKRQKRQSLNNQIGTSGSSSSPRRHSFDSKGSAYGGESGVSKQCATPDGVNAQSIVSNNIDEYEYKRNEKLRKCDGIVLTAGDMMQFAQLVRSVVQEELVAMKRDTRSILKDEVDNMVDQLHRDIINLQAEMLRQFQIHQTIMTQLLEYYSVNHDLVSEVVRLQEEVKRLKKNF